MHKSLSKRNLVYVVQRLLLFIYLFLFFPIIFQLTNIGTSRHRYCERCDVAFTFFVAYFVACLPMCIR